MFVQTHFQRARQQATGANSPLSSSSATGHHHNHHHHNPLQSHSHSSAAQHHPHHRQLHYNQRDQGNHANHGHHSEQHSPQSARARDSRRAQAIKSGAHKIKEEDRRRLRERLTTGGRDDRDHQAEGNQNYLNYYQNNPKAPAHYRQAHIRRDSEFEERNGQQQHHLNQYQHKKKVDQNYISHRQQMSFTQSGPQIQTETTGSGDLLPAGDSATTTTKTESSTTLRLRSASLSKLGSHPSGHVDRLDTRLASHLYKGDAESDQVIRLRSQRATRQACGSFRNSSRSARRGRGPSELRLDRSRRAKFSRFEYQLARVLTALIGPSVIVGCSLTNKIFASDHDQGSSFDIRQDASANTKQKLSPGSHINLGALVAPITRTLHCLILFFVNFLQFQWQTLRCFFKINAWKIFISQFDNNYNDNDGQANSVTAMQAQRRQRPPLRVGAGAYSLDASCVMEPHELSPVNVAPSYDQQQQQDTHHHQRPHQSQPVWMNALFNQPLQSVAGHIHQHNHTAAGLAASSCYQPGELPLLVPGHQAHGVTYFSQPLVGRFRSLDRDVHEPSGPYANHVQHGPAPPMSFVASHQQQVIQPARRNVAPDASQLWKWHMRHTVDGHLPGQEHALNYLPPGGSFDHDLSAHYQQQPVESGGYLHAHQSHGCPAARTLAGMPNRQCLASISSPTLSDYDGIDHWSVPEPSAVTTHTPVPFAKPAAQRASRGEMGQTESSSRGPLASNHQRPSRRQLPQPPNHAGQAHGPAPPADQSSLNPNAKPQDRRLSSIMGSDSELYTAKPTSGHNYNSSDDASVSSASRSRANANLMRFQLGKQTGYQHHQPSSSQPNKAIVSATADRRRFARQASSTSAASQSCANPARVVQRAGTRARAHETPKLAHQCNSLQADSPHRQTQAKTTMVTRSKAPGRLTKSDTESKSPAAGHSPPRVKGHPDRTGSGDNRDSGRPTSAKTNSAKSLAAGGKSKSMVSAHPSPIGVLGKAVSLAGAKRRLGFKQKGGLNSLSVHRSEEYFPAPPRRDPMGGSAATTASNSLNSDSCEVADPSSSSSASRWLSQFNGTAGGGGGGGSNSPDPRVCFVEGLGAGQIASRQALVSPYLGDIQVSLSDRRNMLEVEIIRVRQLQPKPGAKRLPSPYVKVYLMRNKKCAAKFKTRQLQQTLDPLYQQLFIFRDSDYSNCVLQIIVWADYGKKDRKSLMGIVQIHLNDLDISQVVIGWYKLFNAPSMVAGTASSPSVATSSKALRQTLSSTKLGDLATIQKQHQQAADFLELPQVESKQQQAVNNLSK